MKKIKILQVGLSKTLGGIESFVINYFKNIDKDRFVFDFADIYGDGIAYEDEIKKMGGKIFTLPNYKKYPIKMRKKYIEIIEREKYDIIHINALSCANIIPIKAACLFNNIPVIVHCHNSSIPSGTLRRLMHFYNNSKVNNMPIEKWACGIKAGHWMWGDSFNESNVISNAVDPDKFKLNKQIRSEFREKCQFNDNNFVIGFVGRFCEQKNVLFLVSVLEKLKLMNSKYRLLMVGDGELRGEFANKLQEKNISEFVYFTGIQNNAYLWYSAMDCFVLPSKFEGLPFVAIEAQAAGLKSFISDRVTNEIKVTNMVDYISIDNDGTEWAEKINDFAEKNGIGYRSDDNIPDMYNIYKSCRNLESIYCKLLYDET